MSLRALLTVLGCVIAIIGVAPAYGGHVKLKVGDVPPVKLGSHVKLGDYQGKIVIISFFASWCGPCRKELPVLAWMQKAATREKLVIFAVDWQEDYEHFRAIEKALQDTDLTLISDSNGYFGREYDVTAIPHMIMVGRDGKIASIHEGYGEDALPALVDEINTLWRQAPTTAGVEKP